MDLNLEPAEPTLKTAASCHGRVADLCWRLRFWGPSADLKQRFPFFTNVWQVLYRAIPPINERFAMVYRWFFFNVFLEYFSALGISQLRTIGLHLGVGGHWRHLRGSLGLAGHLRNLFRGGAEATAHSGTSLAGSGALDCWGLEADRDTRMIQLQYIKQIWFYYSICIYIYILIYSIL